jgi:hypothetical protein
MRNDGDSFGSSSMSAATSVLAGSWASDLATSSFCHLATCNALPPDYYDTLQKLFPNDRAILRGRTDDTGNAVARLTSVEITDNPATAPACREFVAFHTSGCVMITGHDEEGSKEACLAAGASSYLRKPFDETTLLQAVDQAIAAAMHKKVSSF